MPMRSTAVRCGIASLHAACADNLWRKRSLSLPRCHVYVPALRVSDSNTQESFRGVLGLYARRDSLRRGKSCQLKTCTVLARRGAGKTEKKPGGAPGHLKR